MQRQGRAKEGLRVLLMGRPEHAAADVGRSLAERGHTVVRCHLPGKAPFPCYAVERQCPLDEQPVDVAVLLRDEAWPRPTSFDRGVTCAIRQRTPIVLLGTPVLNPYDGWIEEVVPLSGDAVAAVERVSGRERSEHSRIATKALREALEASEFGAEAAKASVTRRSDRLVVRIRFPEGTLLRAREQAVHRVIRNLRAYDPDARGIDVTVVASERMPANGGR